LGYKLLLLLPAAAGTEWTEKTAAVNCMYCSISTHALMLQCTLLSFGLLHALSAILSGAGGSRRRHEHPTATPNKGLARKQISSSRQGSADANERDSSPEPTLNLGAGNDDSPGVVVMAVYTPDEAATRRQQATESAAAAGTGAAAAAARPGPSAQGGSHPAQFQQIQGSAQPPSLLMQLLQAAGLLPMQGAGLLPTPAAAGGGDGGGSQRGGMQPAAPTAAAAAAEGGGSQRMGLQPQQAPQQRVQQQSSADAEQQAALAYALLGDGPEDPDNMDPALIERFVADQAKLCDMFFHPSPSKSRPAAGGQTMGGHGGWGAASSSSAAAAAAAGATGIPSWLDDEYAAAAAAGATGIPSLLDDEHGHQHGASSAFWGQRAGSSRRSGGGGAASAAAAAAGGTDGGVFGGGGWRSRGGGAAAAAAAAAAGGTGGGVFGGGWHSSAGGGAAASEADDDADTDFNARRHSLQQNDLEAVSLVSRWVASEMHVGVASGSGVQCVKGGCTACLS